MRVHWTDNAIKHLISIYEYIAQNSPFYAQRVVDKLTKRSEQLGDFPFLGRMVPEYEAEDIREIVEKPYRIIYRIKAEQVDVVAVIHSAQILPNDI